MFDVFLLTLVYCTDWSKKINEAHKINKTYAQIKSVSNQFSFYADFKVSMHSMWESISAEARDKHL